MRPLHQLRLHYMGLNLFFKAYLHQLYVSLNLFFKTYLHQLYVSLNPFFKAYLHQLYVSLNLFFTAYLHQLYAGLKLSLYDTLTHSRKGKVKFGFTGLKFVRRNYAKSTLKVKYFLCSRGHETTVQPTTILLRHCA